MDMLQLALIFLVIVAMVAGLLGYTGTATISWETALIVFVVYLIVLGVSFFMWGMRPRPHT
jgi:uncharacterized membrane protein YtjA (UPF0391 family)